MCAEKKRNGNAMVDLSPTTSQPDHCNIFFYISFQLVQGRRSKERSSWTSLKMQNVASFVEQKSQVGTNSLLQGCFRVVSAHLRIACPPFLVLVESEAFKW